MYEIDKIRGVELLKKGKMISVDIGSNCFTVYDYVITNCGNIQWICLNNNKFIPDMVVEKYYYLDDEDE